MNDELPEDVVQNKKTLNRLREEVASLRNDVAEQGVRLTLAQAWIDFLHYAYDALRGYSVDYKLLPEYTKTNEVDEAMGMGIWEGQHKIIKYLRRAKSGIRAAIRRKGFKVH